MYRSPWLICAVLLLLVSLPALAAQQTFEFHHDARMQHHATGPLENAYGYVYVASDKKGHGVIRVMFSNGSPLRNARFNARIQFLDASGELVRKESFSRRIDAAGADGAAEQRLSKLVELNDFASVQVDFFVTDVPQAERRASAFGGALVRSSYSAN